MIQINVPYGRYVTIGAIGVVLLVTVLFFWSKKQIPQAKTSLVVPTPPVQIKGTADDVDVLGKQLNDIDVSDLEKEIGVVDQEK